MSKDYGMRVSLTGKNVETANIQELAFSSKYPIFKVAIKGDGAVSIPGAVGGVVGKNSITIAHNLGRIPMFRVFGSDSSTWRTVFDFRIFYGSTALIGHARITSNNLIISGENSDPNIKTISFSYYIFEDARD